MTDIIDLTSASIYNRSIITNMNIPFTGIEVKINLPDILSSQLIINHFISIIAAAENICNCTLYKKYFIYDADGNILPEIPKEIKDKIEKDYTVYMSSIYNEFGNEFTTSLFKDLMKFIVYDENYFYISRLNVKKVLNVNLVQTPINSKLSLINCIVLTLNKFIAGVSNFKDTYCIKLNDTDKLSNLKSRTSIINGDNVNQISYNTLNSYNELSGLYNVNTTEELITSVEFNYTNPLTLVKILPDPTPPTT